MQVPLTVEFPLRGEWSAPNTPGHRIPSHGSHMLGQTYAYDFMQIDWRHARSFRAYTKPLLPALIFGVPLAQCLGWSQPIHAVFDGEVIQAEDGVVERDPVHLVRDLSIALKNSLFSRMGNTNQDLKFALGNYVIVAGDNAFALFAHARRGSVIVRPGERVTAGQQLAQVGHAGNSTAPHLHFQLMDRLELKTAQGIACRFARYEIFIDGDWREVVDGIPGRFDRIRYLA